MTTRRTQTDPMLGRLFAGRFQIEALIGAGGMGNIYRAIQTEMKRPVALKLLRPDLGGDAEVVARFDREMLTTTRIEHPNSVRVYDHGQAEDGTLYLVMELLDGRLLSDVIADEAPLRPERVAHIGMQIAQALGAAHAEKIVHRDLKPENIMLLDRYGQRDFVKVLDFGLSRFTEDADHQDAGLTQVGVRVGTPMYMAPEYASAFQFDHRSDLYALGLILFEIATGQTPFTGKPYELLDRHVSTPPPRPSSVESAVPPWLDDVILSLLAKKPEARPQAAIQVATTLERGRARILSEPLTEELDVFRAEVEQAVRAQSAPPPPPPSLEPPPPEPGLVGVGAPITAPVAASKLQRARVSTGRTAQGALPRESEPGSPVRAQAAPRPSNAGVAVAGCAGLGLLGLSLVAILLAVAVLFTLP